MNTPIKTVLVGIGGYGRNFYDAVIRGGERNGLVCAGVIQPSMAKHAQAEQELLRLGIAVFPSLEAFFTQGNTADLAVIASPLQYHYEQCKTALENGTHMLCEKPAVVGVRQAAELRALSAKTGKLLAIGYQNSYSSAILSLRQDIADGRYGKAKSMKTLLLSPRSREYYARNSWAGKRYDRNGRPVLDSVANNAGAHSLHLMLYLLGGGEDRAAIPQAVEAAVAKVNSIETFDLCVLRAAAPDCEKITLYAAHVYAGEAATRYRFTWEGGWMEGDFKQDDTLVMHTPQGDVHYGSVALDPLKPLHTVAQAIRRGGSVPCGIQAASSQVECIEALHCAVPDAYPVPPDCMEEIVMPDSDTCLQAAAWIEQLRAAYAQDTALAGLARGDWATGAAKRTAAPSAAVWERCAP